MKKLSFFLMAMLVSLTSFAAALGEGYEKVTNISTLAAGDKVVLYCDDSSVGVTGVNGTKDAAVAATGWVEYLVEAATGGVKLKDTGASKYISLTTKNTFTYATTGSVCKVNANGLLCITLSGSDFFLYQNGSYYRMYVDKTGNSGYKPFYVYKVVPVEVNPDATMYTVTVKSADETMGTVTGGGEYAEGKTATLEASPKAGYEFVKWSNGSTENPLKLTVTEDIELTATFQAQTPITIAEANQLKDAAKCILKEFTVAYIYKSYIHIQDASGYGMIYAGSFGLKAGDVVTGFTCSKSTYNGLPQFTPTCKLADLTVVAGEAPAVAELTTAPTGNYHQVVKLMNLTMTGSFNTSSNTTVKATCPDGTTIDIFNGKNHTYTFVAGKTYNITGDVCQYSGKIQVSTYAIEEYVAPVVNHTIAVSANPAEAGTVTGAGEYEEGTEITLTATPNEGYEFVNWTENEVEVSTNAEYTFEVLADRVLVANFVEAAPEINYEEFIMSNLVVTTPAEGLEMLEASDPVNGISVMLGVYEDGTLHEDCLITFQGMELSIVSSEKVTKEYNEDVETDVYTVRVVVAFGGANMGLQLLMYATAAAEPIIINVEGATVTLTEYQISAEETAYELNMISNWVYEEDGLTYEVECLLPTFDPTKESGDYEASFFVRGEGNAFGMTEDAIVSVAKNGNQITLTGEITAYNNNVYNVTISGTLPVVEPTTITYELNGGELPAPAVPTNEELWIAFMPYYQEYYDVVRAEQPITSVAVFLSAGMGDDATIFTSEDSDYKWLGDYIIKVTTEQSAALTTLANWKFNAQAFFNANQYTGWPKSADFTEAGKPENWGAAYEAAHAVVLPTEPVAEDYVLPTPVKEGYTFVGWYDNAEGTGEAYKVIPAGWAGTLYAIWKQGTTTALENIAVEGKAVKAIINGQLIIIKNGVQYNAQGQVVK